MNDFLCIALLSSSFLMLAVIADVLGRIHEILDSWDDAEDDDDDADDDWPEPDPNH